MRVIATAGHVDHGKSSLVLALTGTDPDRFAEEKRRGLTIDLGFAHAVVGGEAVSFVDVPGHVRFLRNMLAGVGGVDACLFVVAATEGWKPQSEEHLRILELVGVRHGVVALTKVDVLDDPELVELAALEVADHVAGTFLAGGAGRAGRRAARAAASTSSRRRSATSPGTTPAATDRGRARLWVDRAFAAKGSGTVVTGTLTDGSIADRRRTSPSSRAADRRGCGRSRRSAGRSARSGPGNRVALNLAGVEHADARRAATPSWPPGGGALTARFDASARRPRVARPRRVAARRVPRLHRLRRARRAGAGARPGLDPTRARAGSSGCTSASPCPLLPGDRYVLRETGRDETVGGGEVLDVAPGPAGVAGATRPPRGPRRRRAGLGRRRRARAADRRAAAADRRSLGRSTRRRSRRRPRRSASASPPAACRWRQLDERERAVLDDAGRRRRRRDASARLAAAADPLADHPVVAALAAGGLAPPAPEGIDRAELRELARRGVLVERDGLWWHAVGHRRPPARSPPACCASGRTGSPSATFREAAGITRKHAVPLLAELDAPWRHPPPRRPAHRRQPPAGVCRPSIRVRRRGRSPVERRRRRAGQAETRSRRRSSWLRPPQMP